MTTIQNIGHTRGNTFSKTITLRDDAGDLIDLTSYTVKMTVKKNPSDQSEISQETGTKANQTTNRGEVAFVLPATDFNIENGAYYYDIEGIASAVVLTFQKGVFEVSYNVG